MCVGSGTPSEAQFSGFFARETLAPGAFSFPPETIDYSSENECGLLGTRFLQYQVDSCELQLAKRLLWTEEAWESDQVASGF